MTLDARQERERLAYDFQNRAHALRDTGMESQPDSAGWYASQYDLAAKALLESAAPVVPDAERQHLAQVCYQAIRDGDERGVCEVASIRLERIMHLLLEGVRDV